MRYNFSLANFIRLILFTWLLKLVFGLDLSIHRISTGCLGDLHCVMTEKAMMFTANIIARVKM
jgi:hypothetical protein